MSIVILDVETQYTFKEVGSYDKPFEMRLASAVVYQEIGDTYSFFIGEQSRERLINILYGQMVVGFNSNRFDSRVLLGNDRIVDDVLDLIRYPDNRIAWHSYDIMYEVVRSYFKVNKWEQINEILMNPELHGKGNISLHTLVSHTISGRMVGEGAMAPILFRENRFDELLTYNFGDVKYTKELLDFIIKYGYVINGKDEKVYIRRPGEDFV